MIVTTTLKNKPKDRVHVYKVFTIQDFVGADDDSSHGFFYK